jgi:hypothetical protein
MQFSECLKRLASCYLDISHLDALLVGDAVAPVREMKVQAHRAFLPGAVRD